MTPKYFAKVWQKRLLLSDVVQLSCPKFTNPLIKELMYESIKKLRYIAHGPVVLL